jgi:MinD-like ATPase involved in chromosome partitioning or flagellar assembly
MQHIIEALVKDLAEQLRPMVAEMVRQEMANTDGEKALEGIAENINLAQLAGHLSMSDLAAELTDSQLTIIAGDVDLADLASEFDADKIAENLDIDSAIRTFFEDNPATLSF